MSVRSIRLRSGAPERHTLAPGQLAYFHVDIPRGRRCTLHLRMEKAGGDHQIMCGCEAKPAGGTMEKALRGGGCGHQWSWKDGRPLGNGAPSPQCKAGREAGGTTRGRPGPQARQAQTAECTPSTASRQQR